MKKLTLILAIATCCSPAFTFADTNIIEKLDAETIKRATSNKNQTILVLKWKDKAVRNSLLSTPETRSVETNSPSKLRVEKRAFGLQTLNTIYEDTGIALKHIRSSSLNYDVMVTAQNQSSDQLIKNLMSTGMFDSVKVDFKVDTNQTHHFKPLNFKVAPNGLDRTKFNDPAYLLATYLDDQQEGALGNHSFLKANEYVKANDSLNRKVRVAIIDTGYWAHEDVDYSKEDGADFVTTFGFDRYEDCSVVDNTNSGADITCAINNYADDVRDMDPTDKSWDFQKDDEGNPTSDGEICIDGHGLNVASTITSIRNNNKGIVAATDNDDITLVPIRALGCDGGYSIDSADAIVWASGGEVPGMPMISEKVDVINLSLGGFAGFLCDERSFYRDAVSFAQEQGVVVIASAGNASIDVKDFQPASCDGVLAVGSNDVRGELSSSSNFGNDLNITFTGEDINVAIINQSLYANPDETLCSLNGVAASPDTCYGKTSGTSFASPLAAAAVALIKMVKPELDESELRALLSSTGASYDFDVLGNPTIRSTLAENADIANVYKAVTSDLDFMTIDNLKSVHAFNGYESTVDTLYLEGLASITSETSVCNMYELSWGNYKDAVTDVEYFIYGSVSSDAALSFDNSTVLTNGTASTNAIVNIADNNRVGVSPTVDGESGKIFEFDLSNSPKPSFCM